MSIISVVGVVVAGLLLGSASIVNATEDANAIKSRSAVNHNNNAAIVPPPRQAPVGHRQPRVSDIPSTTLSPLDLELRREDELIDRKLIICRGC